MEQLKLFLSLPFKLDGKENDYDCIIKELNPHRMKKYLEALGSEVITSATDTNGFSVEEIEIGYGSYCHYECEAIEKLYALIRRYFHVSAKCRIILHASPVAFSFYRMMVGKHLNNATICFDLACLDEKGLKEAGFTSTIEDYSNAMQICFDNGYKNIAVCLNPNYMNNETLAATLKKLNEYHITPEWISFKNPLNEEQLKIAKEILEPLAFTFVDGYFTRVKPYAQIENQIGCGIKAITKFDNILFQNTDDLQFYIDNSQSFDKISHRID